MNQKIKILQIIHFGLCTGVTFAYIFLGDLFNTESFPMPELETNTYIFVGIPVVAILASSYVFKILIKSIGATKTIDENFMTYQTASIVRWAIIEGAAFLLLFIRKDFMLFGMLLIGYLYFLRPTQERVTSDIQQAIRNKQ